MSKEKVEVCNICKQSIVIGKEEYCKLSQFALDGKLFKEGFYHVVCYRDHFLTNKKLTEDSKLFMHNAFQTLEDIKKGKLPLGIN